MPIVLRRFLAALVVWLSVVVAWAGDDKSRLPDITAPSEPNGFVDLAFAIRAIDFDASGNCTVRAYGQHRGRIVGLSVTFNTNPKAGIVGGPIASQGLTRNGIVYSTVGSESDAFIQILASLYGVTARDAKFKERVSGSTFALEGNPENMRNENVHFKVFLTDSNSQGYAELYTNINVKTGVLEIFEKDPEYRRNVIRALSANP